MDMTPGYELALEYVSALRGHVTDRDLNLVESPAFCGEILSSIITAVALANLYEIDLPADLHERALAIFEGYPSELSEFKEILASAPAARGVNS